jgi:hypothetical protein
MHQAKKTINDERIARGSKAYFEVKEKKKNETDKLDQTRSKVCLYSLAIKESNCQESWLMYLVVPLRTFVWPVAGKHEVEW